MSSTDGDLPKEMAAESALSACARVTGTVELLDEILQDLSLRQIFTLQRINKTFQAHIRGDTLTAKRLFLTPTSDHSQFREALHDDYADYDVSPPFTYRNESVKFKGCQLRRKLIVTLDYDLAYYEMQECARDALPSSSPSWCDMFLTQPPITQGWISQENHMDWRDGREDAKKDYALLTRPDGIKLRDLIEGGLLASDKFCFVQRYICFEAVLDSKDELCWSPVGEDEIVEV